MNYEEAKKAVEGYKVSLAVEGMSLIPEAEDLAMKVALGEITAEEANILIDKKMGWNKVDA